MESRRRWGRRFTIGGSSFSGLGLVVCFTFFAGVLVVRAKDTGGLGLEAPGEMTSPHGKAESIIISDRAATSADYREAWRAWLQKHAVEPLLRDSAGRNDDAVTREILDAFVKDWSHDWDMIGRAGWNVSVSRGPLSMIRSGGQDSSRFFGSSITRRFPLAGQ